METPSYALGSKITQLQKLKEFYKKNPTLTFDFKKESLFTLIMIEQIVSSVKQESAWIDSAKSILHDIKTYTILEDQSQILSKVLVLESSSEILPFETLTIVEFLRVYLSSDHDRLKLIQCQIGVCIMFIRLYIPSSFIDPASYAKLKLSIVNDSIKKTNSDSETCRLSNEIYPRDYYPARISFFENILLDLEKRRNKYESGIFLRPDISQIAGIQNDLVQLSTQMISDSHIGKIVDKLLTSRNDGIQMEQSTQDSLLNFVNKMRSKYPLYSDILLPIYNAVYHLKNSLKLFVFESEGRSFESVEINSIRHLLTFDAIDSSEFQNDILSCIKSLNINSRELIASKWELAMAFLYKTCATLSNRGQYQEPFARFHSIFISIVDLWSECDIKKRESDAKKAELYRFKGIDTEILSENELDESDLLKSFPNYYDEFPELVTSENILNSEGSVKAISTNESQNWIDITDEECHRVRCIHEFMIERSDVLIDFELLWGKAFETSFSTANKLFGKTSILEKEFDFSSRAGIEYLTSLYSDRLSTGSVLLFEKRNFYRHENLAEAKKMINVLSSFDSRLTELLSQWPDHLMLLQMSTICHRILNFAVSSPIPKFMTGLELLLQKVDEWEKYASHTVSLKAHIDDISQLIISWRKLELQSWRELLDFEDSLYYTKSSKLWFHLYNILVSLCFSTSNSEVFSN